MITINMKNIDAVIVESIEIMGHNVYYIPRESFDNGDMIFGEYSKSKFNKAYLIEAYLANVEGFEGDGDFFSKFGLEIRDSSNFIISRRSFTRHLPTTMRGRPQEGDLIYVPLMHRLFEIKFIEKKLMFYSLGNREPYIYEMRCELFRFSEDEIATGITEIDQVAEENSYTMRLNVSTTGQSNFVDGEIIYQSTDGTWSNNTAYGTISEWYKANGAMFLHNIVGQFTANANVYGNVSQSIYRSISYDDRTDFNPYDDYDNQIMKTQADVILDLSETNPFGTP